MAPEPILRLPILVPDTKTWFWSHTTTLRLFLQIFRPSYGPLNWVSPDNNNSCEMRKCCSRSKFWIKHLLPFFAVSSPSSIEIENPNNPSSNHQWMVQLLVPVIESSIAIWQKIGYNNYVYVCVENFSSNFRQLPMSI